MGQLLKMQIPVHLLQIYWSRLSGDKAKQSVFYTNSDSFTHKNLESTGL